MIKEQIKKFRANKRKTEKDGIFDRLLVKTEEVKELTFLAIDSVVPVTTLNSATVLVHKIANGLHSIFRANGLAQTSFGKIAGGADILNTVLNEAESIINKGEEVIDENEFIRDRFDSRSSIDSTIFQILIDYAIEKELLYKRVSTWKKTAYKEETKEKQYGAWKGSIDGVEFGWLGHIDKQMDSYFFYNDAGDINELIASVKRRFWDRKSNHIVMNVVTEEASDYDMDRNKNRRFVLEDEEEVVSYSSALADRLSSTMAKYQARNLHRTVLLYGPPGTGKTTAIREFVNKSGLRSLRIPVGFLNASSYMTSTLKIIQPDIIVIDDFDRINDQGKILDMLTDFKKLSQCVLLSCNSLKLSDAILRPGRIDEIIEHHVLDDVVIDRVLGPFKDQCDVSVRGWPIAYIEEFVKRAEVLGIEDALTSFKDLERRNKKANISWKKDDSAVLED